MKKSILLLLMIPFLGVEFLQAQSVGASPKYVKALTSEWKGDRLTDGRPHVSDEILERLENVTLEQAWGYLRRAGYRNQVEGDWIIIQPDDVMTGRVVTAQFMPYRPDLDSLVRAEGKAEGRSQKGGINTWPIDVLTEGDIYVADGYGKIKDGTLIGSSLGNAIYGKTGKGVIFYGSVRDMEELRATEGFNGWIKGHDPSFIRDMTPVSINAPIRIGGVSVLPGDVVMANKYGTIFIPAHLVEGLVTSAEMTGLRDEFERVLLQENKYLTGEIHGNWSDEIKQEFRNWIDNYPKELSITQKDLDDYLED